jgi:hypothetical protein
VGWSQDPIAVSGKRRVGGWTISYDNLLSSAPFRGNWPDQPWSTFTRTLGMFQLFYM